MQTEKKNSEKSFWQKLGRAWFPVFGSINELGFSIEWHDFFAESFIDWGRSFHRESVEVCLNLEGIGVVGFQGKPITIGPATACLYRQGAPPLDARRNGGERHKYLTIELSFEFLKSQLPVLSGNLHPLVHAIVKPGSPESAVGEALRLSTAQRDLIHQLRNPPVLASAQALWYRAKVLELLAELLFEAPTAELFCTRQKRLAMDRVEKVKQILREQLVDPPSLETISRRVGCSPYYLSRTFSREMGMTIPQYLRSLRIEKAAELLKSGKCNVTEAAMEVGYNSMSHFSQAFCQMMGCCPAMYPDAKSNDSKKHR